MRAYQTIAGDEHNLCSRNDPFSENGPQTVLVPVLLREIPTAPLLWDLIPSSSKPGLPYHRCR